MDDRTVPIEWVEHMVHTTMDEKNIELVCKVWRLEVPETNVSSTLLGECLSKGIVQWIRMAMHE